MRIGTHEFDIKNQTYIMGILNVTPDSFSDGGKIQGVDAALRRAEDMIKEGAAILDIGGESTRPGYTPVSEEEEMERVLPVVEAIKQRLDIPVSVDTYKSKVAESAILAGAAWTRSISIPLPSMPTSAPSVAGPAIWPAMSIWRRRVS